MFALIEYLSELVLFDFIHIACFLDTNILVVCTLKAQKLISLCGWELRSLPYIVHHKVQQPQSTETVKLGNQPNLPSNNGSDLVCYLSGSRNKEVDDKPQVSELSDPNSVVLYCSFCSATVGLWTFSLVPRPVEFLRLVGHTEVNGENDSAQAEDENHDANAQSTKTNFASSSSSQEKSLNLTIAGGPPPAKQNYRATISLPVIGRSLRTRFFTDFHVGKDQGLSLSEANMSIQGANQIGERDSDKENSLGNMQVIAQDTGKDDKLETDDSTANTCRPQVGECIGSNTGDNVITNVNNKGGEKNAAIVVATAPDKQCDGQHENVNKAGVQPLTNSITPDSFGK